MEPDIIRMYSSSPPPLDNGTEDDDDDEFGEFGGFSEVESSAVGFADFDTHDYPNSKEEFIPPNHFIPIPGYSDGNGFSSGKTDDACFAELSEPARVKSEIFDTVTCNDMTPSRTLNSAFDGRTSSVCVTKRVRQKEYFVKQERISPDAIGSEASLSTHDQEISNCNGNKVPCLEILTNGFTVLDSVNTQGIEDLDIVSNVKGLKTIHTCSTEDSVDTVPSKVFDGSTTVSIKSTILLEETKQQAHKALDDEVPKSKENDILNQMSDGSPQRVMLVHGTWEDKSELEPVQLSLSEDNAAYLEVNNPELQNPSSCGNGTTIGIGQHPTSSKSKTEEQELESVEGMDKFKSENKIRKNVEADVSMMCSSTNIVNDSRDRLEQVPTSSSVHTNIVELDDFGGLTNSDINNDFTSLSVTNVHDYNRGIPAIPPPTVGDAQISEEVMFLGSTSEQFRHVGKPEGAFEFADFSADLHPEFPDFDMSKEQMSDALSDIHGIDGTFSDVAVMPSIPVAKEDDVAFGDFDSVPKNQGGDVQDFHDFADFSSASCDQAVEWNAFDDVQKGSSWAAFADDSLSNVEEPWQPHRTEMPFVRCTDQVGKKPVSSTSHETDPTVPGQDSAAVLQASLLGRLERIFQVCFPSVLLPEVEETVTTLEVLLEHGEVLAKSGESSGDSGRQLDVWLELQNIHDGYGLRYQWGGSHSNKMLLCSLGIDIRNILFTGNKKQPVIVPMYASGLGMLEPTKEPLKPVSAAEKITSIGHTPPVSPEITPPDQLQESLPPVQFDWSSSGLTNPLDGVDPELYELTTSHLESSNRSSKVTDAFAKLMSTVEKTSTSTRKPKKEEHLSEEAAKVIASLPDLSFMHAKVLMFPATLTPSTSCQEKVD
ncbi:aftiphilin [Ambystoma mexicanum]|uniref:aftiphilin n=1 Tax=Ambystoma mexicanum TaxID=8296 RepID=UPI0037E80A6D